MVTKLTTQLEYKYLHLNRVKRRLIFDQQLKTHPCHRGKIWEYAGYFVYITDSNCILLDQMIREALNNQVLGTKGIILSPHRIIWVQQGWLNIIEIAIRCVSPLSKDQKTRFEVEILTTVWYQGKGHLIMFIGTNIRKLNWNKSSIMQDPALESPDVGRWGMIWCIVTKQSMHC